MRKGYVLAMVLLLASIPASSTSSRRILIDFSHDERIKDTEGGPQPCFDLLDDRYEIVISKDEITYRNIQDYDMLLICLPRRSFVPSEIEVISRFVDNGGGLLLLTDLSIERGKLKPMNSLSMYFGVEFTTRVFDAAIVVDTRGQIHPVFQDVKEIAYLKPSALNVEEPSKGLLYLEGRCIMAYCEYGKGRVIYLTNNELIFHEFIEALDNRQFIVNTFNWLAEPGGPYLQQRTFVDKGVMLMVEGKKKIESR